VGRTVVRATPRKVAYACVALGGRDRSTNDGRDGVVVQRSLCTVSRRLALRSSVRPPRLEQAALSQCDNQDIADQQWALDESLLHTKPWPTRVSRRRSCGSGDRPRGHVTRVRSACDRGLRPSRGVWRSPPDAAFRRPTSLGPVDLPSPFIGHTAPALQRGGAREPASPSPRPAELSAPTLAI